MLHLLLFDKQIIYIKIFNFIYFILLILNVVYKSQKKVIANLENEIISDFMNKIHVHYSLSIYSDH